MNTERAIVLALIVVATGSLSPIGNGAEPKPDSDPVAAKDALDLLHVPEGFEVELVVAEPDVIDPVAFTWGPDGRLWVAEMTDYPSGMDGEGKAGGKIRWLRDKDGDGRYEESVIFAEGLSFPNGVLPWKKGVLVTAARRRPRTRRGGPVAGPCRRSSSARSCAAPG